MYYLTSLHFSRKLVWQWAEETKTEAEKLEDFIAYENQDI